MNRFKVIWHDYEDDCSHCAVFESVEQNPYLAARVFLAGLGNVAKYGYQIETSEAVQSSEAVGHRF